MRKKFLCCCKISSSIFSFPIQDAVFFFKVEIRISKELKQGCFLWIIFIERNAEFSLQVVKNYTLWVVFESDVMWTKFNYIKVIVINIKKSCASKQCTQRCILWNFFLLLFCILKKNLIIFCLGIFRCIYFYTYFFRSSVDEKLYILKNIYFNECNSRKYERLCKENAQTFSLLHKMHIGILFFPL